MADPLPTTEPAAETVGYRPLSGFAIAGLALACLFGLLVLVSAVVALVQGVPFFFTPWLMLVAIAGLVLSFVAQSHIRNSEGTRAGMGLARAGVWISLLSGLGYFAYYYVTGLALTNQANAFLMEPGPDSGFFPHMKKAGADPAELNAAFLLSLPASNRGSIRPDDEAAMVRAYDAGGQEGSGGPLSQFRDTQLVRLFTHGNAGADVRPLGVVDWSYENRSYQVYRNYRVTAPEATAELTVLVRSTEGESAGQVRKWYLVLQQTSRPKLELTELGKGLRQFRPQARQEAERWQDRLLTEGRPFPEFKDVDRTNWDAVGLPQRQVAAMRDRIRDLFAAAGKDRFSLQFSFEDPVGNWERDADGRLHFLFPLRVLVPPLPTEGPLASAAEGLIGLRSAEPLDPLVPRDESRWEVESIRFRHIAQIKKGPK